MTRHKVFQLIRAERRRQEKMWGKVNREKYMSEYPNELDLATLAGELGEVAEVVNDMRDKPYLKGEDWYRHCLITELVHVAAVAARWLERIK